MVTASTGVRRVNLARASLAVCLALPISGAAAATPGPKVVQVDCDGPRTLAAALDDRSERLVVEFEGECEEDVLIARDDVTLRGIAPGAIVRGTPGLPPAQRQPGVRVEGGRRVTLETFAIQDSDSRGIQLTRGAEVVIRSLTVDGNARGGILMLGASRALVRDSTFDGNGVSDGIGVWENSSLTLGGTVSADGNDRAGILASDSSSVAQDFGGVQITANGNGFVGVTLQLGAQLATGPTIQADGNGAFGVLLYFDVMFTAPLTATQNDVGLWLEAATMETLNSDIQGNFSGDVFLDFGSIASFFGGNNTVGSIDCGDGVLTRGDVSCPAPLAAVMAGPETGAPRAKAVRPVQPLTLER
jgi:hypothetical protein